MSASIRVTTEIAVEPAIAFEVFTEEIASWWRGSKDIGTGRAPPVGTLRFEPGVGGRLLEVYDEAAGRVFEIGRVLVWKPAECVVFEYRAGNFQPDQVTEVEVRFERIAEGTRVTLEHRGFETLPLDHPARHGLAATQAFERMMVSHWAEHLAELKGHAEGGSS